MGERTAAQGTESCHPLPAVPSPWSLHSPLYTPGFPLSLLPGLHPTQVTLGLRGPGSEVARTCQGIPKFGNANPFSVKLPSRPGASKSTATTQKPRRKSLLPPPLSAVPSALPEGSGTAVSLRARLRDAGNSERKDRARCPSSYPAHLRASAGESTMAPVTCFRPLRGPRDSPSSGTSDLSCPLELSATNLGC